MDGVSTFIVISSLCGLAFAGLQFWIISKVDILKNPFSRGTHDDAHATLLKCYNAIRKGSNAFLFAEYVIFAIFLVVAGLLVMVMTSAQPEGRNWLIGRLSALSFVVGGLTSIASGFIGMSVATYANARTTIAATAPGENGWNASFNTAFRAGAVMGFALCGLALLVLYILLNVLSSYYPDNYKILFECCAGYGLGGSSIALFGRVGGGIYTKAADVGADLAGKVVESIPEDSPRNPATIADNVGDNVGDVAGMGSDLFGSFAEATCAALVISAQSETLISHGWGTLMFPLGVSACGIIVCALCSLIATDLDGVRKEKDIERVLKIQLFSTAVAMSLAVLLLALFTLPAEFTFSNFVNSAGKPIQCTRLGAYFCVLVGLWAGCIIGLITEYYTSHSYNPVREVAQSCETGAATNIIYGLALGMKSAVLPVILIAICVYVAFKLSGMYGIALSALGMLGTLATCLSIDVYGPVCDNAGGIAEMSEFPPEVREKTDALDAAGNTTAAIGKGFAIGSAALVSLALFGGFVARLSTYAGGNPLHIKVLRPNTFAWLFIGAMLPYWFTAMCMKSVGHAAMVMVKEVARQFETIPGLLEGTPGHGEPDHSKCISICVQSSLREMVAPGLLVIFAPIIAGSFFGIEAVCGLLVGGLTSGVQLALSQANSGGAWDNAKKYVEKGCVKTKQNDGSWMVQGKGTELHKAAVVGDTVGDPLKDTSGPALNILMKLMAIISLVFADFFMSMNCGTGVFQLPTSLLFECGHQK